MEFSLDKFRGLLLQSKSLFLLPDAQRDAYINYVMKADKGKQEATFRQLIADNEKSEEAEKVYQKKIKKAWDEYLITIQKLQREGLMEMRTKKESKSKKAEETDMSNLLDSLNNI